MPLEQISPSVGTDQLGRVGVLGGLDELDLAVAQVLQLLELESRTQQGISQQLQQQQPQKRWRRVCPHPSPTSLRPGTPRPTSPALTQTRHPAGQRNTRPA